MFLIGIIGVLFAALVGTFIGLAIDKPYMSMAFAFIALVAFTIFIIITM